MNDDVKKTYMIPKFLKREDALPLAQKLTLRSQDENHYVKGIYLKNKFIGFINDVVIQKDEKQNLEIELGYALNPEFHNQGYATEALTAVINDLFNKGFYKVFTGYFSENIASKRVMEKSGMVPNGISEIINYQNIDHLVYYYEIKNKLMNN